MSYYYNRGGDPKLSLKVTINKEKTKVLFAEATGDFVDVLLSFLTFPLGKLVKILGNHSGDGAPTTIGSLTTLYKGLSNLDISQFCVGGAKKMLVNPKSWFEEECCRLKIDIGDSHPTKYFSCQQDLKCRKNYSGRRAKNVSLYSDIATCRCGRPLNKEWETKGVGDYGDEGGGVFIINQLSFFITDDLRVTPIVAGFSQTLDTHGITDTEGAELTCFSFRKNNILDLLKLSLFSATPLTDLLLKKSTPMSSTAESGILLDHILQGRGNGEYSRKMGKVFLQKSTKKFLFAEATNEFVEFLCSLVTVPLGGVEFLLEGNTGLKSIDNLYKSVTELMEDKCFRTPETKNRLTNPKLAHGYVSTNQFLPLTQADRPKLYFTFNVDDKSRISTLNFSLQCEEGDCSCCCGPIGTSVSPFKSSMETYVKKHTVYYVTDDLTVTPSLATRLSILNGNGIPLSDLMEIEVEIGLEEALKILKASLTSKTPLSDVLIKTMLYKNKLAKVEDDNPVLLYKNKLAKLEHDNPVPKKPSCFPWWSKKL